ncbi:MAG TPA: patatin-like phospholipase family protein [Devosiaceae bacterium]|nr:patatin-like phospholipase family protein [Devosiaceae bacterium]
MPTVMARPRIGVAMGSGSARGLTLVPYLEAIDELGIRPSVIAGSSIGAFIGAGWAMGMRGTEIREHSIEVLGTMNAIMGRLWNTQMAGLKNLFREGLPMQFDAEKVIRQFKPAAMPERFEDLEIPLYVVATDFRSWHQIVFHSGPLITAIAGSIAIPSFFKPVPYGDRLLVDGGVVNPLPLDATAPGADFLIGLDVNGDPSEYDPARSPTALDVGFGAAQIMMHVLITNTIAAHPPDVYARTPVAGFGAFEYWRVREMLAAADADKERFKRELGDKLEAFTSGPKRTI